MWDGQCGMAIIMAYYVAHALWEGKCMMFCSVFSLSTKNLRVADNSPSPAMRGLKLK